MKSTQSTEHRPCRTKPDLIGLRFLAGVLALLTLCLAPAGAETPVRVMGSPALFVDDDNTSGPWDGTAAHPYRLVQQALDACTTGGTVIVAPGSYKENLKFNGKNLELRSHDVQSDAIVKTTILDGQQKGAVVTLKGTEDASCRIAGLTITGGKSRYGGGICGNGTRATIMNNRIIVNKAYDLYFNVYQQDDPFGYLDYYDWHGFGGGLYQCDGLIMNNIIAGNKAGGRLEEWPYAIGGGDGKPLEPPHSTSMQADFRGGALYQCRGEILNNTIWGNITEESSVSGTGITSSTWMDGNVSSCTAVIQNNILWANSGPALFKCSLPSYCCVEGGNTGGIGNIALPPDLVNPGGGDYHLRPTSPCIDNGGYTRSVVRDFEGDPRGYNATTPRWGDGSAFDIGADEYVPPNPAVWVLAPEGGESFLGGMSILVHWQTDLARAGSGVRIDLRQGNRRMAVLGEGSDPEGDLLQNVRLPDLHGSDFRIRVVSLKDSALWAQTPPFDIGLLNTGIEPGAWQGYR